MARPTTRETTATTARRSRAGARLLALALAVLGNACTYCRGDDRVLVSSTPAGAVILIDGEDCGQTTPSMVVVGGIAGSGHAITVRKRGFVDETRQVYHYTTAHAAKWIDGAMDPGLWLLPLWWTLGDWVLPLGVRWRYVPHELHVRLYKENEGPVTGAEPGAEPVAEPGAR